jgi:hypothetical protein
MCNANKALDDFMRLAVQMTDLLSKILRPLHYMSEHLKGNKKAPITCNFLDVEKDLEKAKRGKPLHV